MGEGVLLLLGLAVLVDDIGHPVPVALVRDDGDVAGAEGDNIPRLPVGHLVGIQGEDGACLLYTSNLAAKSGIDVRIVTPHVPDKWYVHMVTRS